MQSAQRRHFPFLKAAPCCHVYYQHETMHPANIHPPLQAIALLDTLDKDVNTFVMRVREWYSWHFPELVRIVPDNYTYARLALAIQEKGSLSDDRKDELAEIAGESTVTSSQSIESQGVTFATCTRLVLAIQGKGSLSDDRKEELAEIAGGFGLPT